MRELHGVIPLSKNDLSELKRQALLFDKFHLLSLPRAFGRSDNLPLALETDLDFLRSKGLIRDFPYAKSGLSTVAIGSASYDITRDLETRRYTGTGFQRKIEHYYTPPKTRVVDQLAREMAASFAARKTYDVVPICRQQFPEHIGLDRFTQSAAKEIVMQLGIRSLPVPGPTAAWEDILNFRSELEDKKWALRRFLRSLSKTQSTAAEIRDEIEETLDVYSAAMKLHKLKASQSFVEVVLVTPLEIIENLIHLEWSKIAKGVLQVRKRKIELMEGEMNAPGRECAYVFHAKERFGPK